MTSLPSTLSREGTGLSPEDAGAVGTGRPARRGPALPVAALAATAGLLVLAGWRLRFGGAALGATVADTRGVLVGPVVLAFTAAVLLAERVRPARPRPLLARGARQDAAYLVLTGLVAAPVSAAGALALSAVLERVAPWLVLPHLGWLPRPLEVAVVVVAMDAANWCCHLGNHRIATFWRLHALHHSQEEMGALTTFRTHPLVHATYLPAILPGLLLLRSGPLPEAVLTVYGCLVVFSHANLDLGFGPLGRVLVSPNYHRVHHRSTEPFDVNLGFALSIWDQLAGRAVFPTPELAAGPTGLAGRPVPVEQEGRRWTPLATLAAQLVEPFLSPAGRRGARGTPSPGTTGEPWGEPRGEPWGEAR